MEEITNIDPALAAAIVKVQSQVKTIERSKTAKVTGQGKNGTYEYTYKYAAYSDIMEAIKEIMGNNKLAAIHMMKQGSLVSLLLHDSGTYIQSIEKRPDSITDPAKIGAWRSYMERYAVRGLLGLATDEDVDDPQAGTEDEVQFLDDSEQSDFIDEMADLELNQKDFLNWLTNNKVDTIDQLPKSWAGKLQSALDATRRKREIAEKAE